MRIKAISNDYITVEVRETQSNGLRDVVPELVRLSAQNRGELNVQPASVPGGPIAGSLGTIAPEG